MGNCLELQEFYDADKDRETLTDVLIELENTKKLAIDAIVHLKKLDKS